MDLRRRMKNEQDEGRTHIKEKNKKNKSRREKKIKDEENGIEKESEGEC